MELDNIKTKLRETVPDFASAIAPTYESMNWQWSPGGTAPHVPDIKEIRDTLYACIDGLSEKWVAHGSGGLEAFYNMPSKGESGEYGLRFVFSNIVYFN